VTLGVDEIAALDQSTRLWNTISGHLPSTFETEMRAKRGPPLTKKKGLRLFLARPTGRVEGHNFLPQLHPLLRAVVAWLAKALQIVSVEEQRLIALVRRDVIHDSSDHDVLVLKAELAQWLGG
jgi:hypothetical protein